MSTKLSVLSKAHGENTSLLTKCCLSPHFHIVCILTGMLGQWWPIFPGIIGLYKLGWVGVVFIYLKTDYLSGCFSLQPPQVQSCVFSFQSPSKCGQETPIYSTLTFMPKTECAGFGMVGRAWAWGIRGGQEGHAGIQIFLLIHYRNPFLFSDKVAWMFVCFMPKMFFSPLELPF